MKIDLGITVGNMAENYGSNYVINHVVVNDIKKLGRGGWCQRTEVRFHNIRIMFNKLLSRNMTTTQGG